MRLIDAASYHIEHFIGDDIPPYVILSHTWGAEEVTLQDMIDNNYKHKAGFKKIELCCKQARKTDYKYAWVDTCCIDKTSSAELSEAINSMYRWYRNSAVGYVFLTDTSVTSGRLYTDTTSSVCSRWFTRGWTLQELLAPQLVEFYDKDWIEIGTKGSLASEIYKITGIDTRMLYNSDALDSFSIARKFSWASRRQTTRIEDRAYSLLGLFNVNMSLLYGERENAFQRLQRKIIKNSNDMSIFGWSRPISKEQERIAVTGLLAESLEDFADIKNVSYCGPSGTVPVFEVDGIKIDLYSPEGDKPTFAFIGSAVFGESSSTDKFLCVRLYYRRGDPRRVYRYQELMTITHEEHQSLIKLPKKDMFFPSESGVVHAEEPGLIPDPEEVESSWKKPLHPYIPTFLFSISADRHGSDLSHLRTRLRYIAHKSQGTSKQDQSTSPQKLKCVDLEYLVSSEKKPADILDARWDEATLLPFSEPDCPTVILTRAERSKYIGLGYCGSFGIVEIADQKEILVSLVIGTVQEKSGPRAFMCGRRTMSDLERNLGYPPSNMRILLVDRAKGIVGSEGRSFELSAKTERRGCASHSNCECRVFYVTISLKGLGEQCKPQTDESKLLEKRESKAP